VLVAQLAAMMGAISAAKALLVIVEQFTELPPPPLPPLLSLLHE
jgi:hypothetical protein